MAQATQRPDHAIVVETDEAGRSPDPLRTTRERFAVMQTFWSSIHDEALKDDRFIAGEQWPESIKHDREADGRPCLTYNLLPAFTRQIVNKVRQTTPQLQARPVEADRPKSPKIANLAGSKDYSMADVYGGIIKNIQQLSSADQAIDTALKHAVDHGFGWFGVRNDWAVHDPFVQELRIFRVKNSYAVLADPSAQAADFSDMQDAFLFTTINRGTFEQKYPDANAADFHHGMGYMEGWYDADSIRIAQYYFLEYERDEVLLLSNGKTVYRSDVESVLDDIEREEGIHIATDDRGKEMRRAVRRPVCRWQKMTACELLEGPLDLPFEHVPLFPVFGEEQLVDGAVRYESAHRHARDPQRSFNYWRTAAAETVALAPRAPWMATARQLSGHEKMYEEANARNLPYLLYNHIDGVPPPQRSFAENIPVAELQMAIQDANDIQTIIGLHEASLGADGNEKSGRAIERRQAQGLTSTYHFSDNLSRALKHMGRVLISAIPRVYDTRRVLRIRLPDTTEDFVEINKTVIDQATGKEVLVHDIAYGRYDVVMEVGESYETQRQEARDTQLQILKLLGPQQAANIVHLVVKNVGGPGSEEIYRVLRKMLPDALKSDEERQADLPPGVTLNAKGEAIDEKTGQPYQPPPTPAQQLQAAELNVQQDKAQADEKDAAAKTAMAAAKLKEAELKLAELEKYGVACQARDDQQFLADVSRIVKEALDQHEQNTAAHQAAFSGELDEQAVAILERVKRYVDRQVGQLTGAAAE